MLPTRSRTAQLCRAYNQAVSDDVPQNQDQSRKCEASGCTNPGGAFTSERDGEIYEFCSEACRAAFEHPTG